MPWWLRFVLAVVLVGALVVSLLWLFQRRLIYQPDARSPGSADQVLAGGLDVVLRTGDGLALGAWFVPARSGGCFPTVLIAPGNAGHRADRVPLARALTAHGFGVLLMDYRGYGGNPGRPSESGLGLDAGAAYEFLTGQQGIPDSALVYFGESLGAAVVTGLATEHRPAVLILRSPFTDLPAAAAVQFPFLPVRWMLWDEWPLANQLSGSGVPTTVIYGTADTVIPAEVSLAVAQAAGERATVVAVPSADHNDRVLLDGPAVVDAVVLAAKLTSC